MIYYLYYSYVPNTASFNRALSYFKSLDKLRINATIVFLMPDSNNSRLKERYSNIKIKYLWDNYYIPLPRLKYISYYLYTLFFINRLKEGDIVYVDGLEKIAKRILKKRGVKLYVESTECPEVYTYLNPIHELRPKDFIQLCKKADGLFVISSALKAYYNEKGIDEKKIHIINMTVDTDRFSSLNKTTSKIKYIAYCGTVSNNKDGVDRLIKAYSIVAKSHPEVSLYIIGSIPSKQEECGNIQLIKSMGLEDKIHLTGLVPAEQMPQLLKNAVLLALARPNNKQAKYGFPTKLGEYLMTENPVAVTAVGDIPLFLTDGVNALIPPACDDSAMAQKMIWAIEHPQESSVIGIRGREVAEKCFNALIETKKMVDIMTNQLFSE